MTPPSTTRDHTLSFLAGLAEATVWPVVPDVWTSWVALHRPRRTPGTVLWALGGALVGGAVTHTASTRLAPRTSAHLLTLLPGIGPGMVAGTLERTTAPGHLALVSGPTRGIPYKVFARSEAVLAAGRTGGAPREDRRLGPFLRWSMPSRLPRFAVVTAAVGGIGHVARARAPRLASPRVSSALFVAGWGACYAWYLPAVTRAHG